MDTESVTHFLLGFNMKPSTQTICNAGAQSFVGIITDTAEDVCEGDDTERLAI